MTDSKGEKKFVDIDKIFSENESGILSKLPGFVVSLIKRIIQQDEINRVLNKYAHTEGIDFHNGIIEEFNLTLEVEGKENLPENSKCFFAANHPFGVIDGLVLTHTVHEKYGRLKAIANDAFMFLPQLRPLIAAVNVYGQSSKEYIKALDEVYNSNVPITHFPAGEVSRYYKGKVQDSEWQKSFITKAISCKRDIVPFHFYGKNSGLFYFIYRFRTMLGIKMNFELILLPREMFKKKNQTIKLKIGKPISYKTLKEASSHKEMAQIIRSKVYDI